MTTYHAVPLNRCESALMQDGLCVGVLTHDESNGACYPRSPSIHLMLRSFSGDVHFCGDAGPTMAGLNRITKALEGAAQRQYERAMAD